MEVQLLIVHRIHVQNSQRVKKGEKKTCQQDQAFCMESQGH